MEKRMYGFEKLEVWQESRTYTIAIYEISKHFPTSEQFGMVSQLRRAAVSIASNIAEGTSRESNKEKIRFVEIAYGSLLESYCQLQLSCDLGYLSEEVFERMTSK